MKLSRKFTKTYLAVFFSIIVTLVISQWFIHKLLVQREKDAHFVNLAGRQRMLSQRIVKFCLLLKENPTQDYMYRLDTTLIYWQKVHQTLVTNPENTPEIRDLYQPLDSMVKNIVFQSSLILSHPKDSLAFQNLIAYDQPYIELMNKIVEKMAQYAEEKLIKLQKIQFALTGLCILLLIGKAEFIFRPLARYIDKYLVEIEESARLIKNQNNELETLNEELKQSFEELQVAQEKLLSQKGLIEKQNAYQKAILDNSALMIITTTPTGTINSFNPAAEAALGYDSKELIDKETPFVFHDPAQVEERAKELSERFQEDIEAGFDVFVYPTQKGLRNTSEWTYVRKDGSKFPVFLSITALRVEENVIGFIGIAEDISEKKAAENLLKEQNEMLNSLSKDLKNKNNRLESTQEILKNQAEKLNGALVYNRAIMNALSKSALVSIADQQGRITSVNSIFCEISGYTEAELLGQNHRLINSGYHSKGFWAEMWKTIRQGKTWRSEVCNRAKDGSLYWVDMVINPIVDQEGNIDQYLAIRTVITERKNAEKELQENYVQLEIAQEKLAQNQKRLKLVLEATHIGIWENPFLKRKIKWDTTCQTMLGLNTDQTTAEEWKNLVKADYWEKIETITQQFLERKISFSTIEYQTVPIKGVEKYIFGKATMLYDDQQNPLGLIGTMEDITERKHLEKLVYAQNQELQTSLGQILLLQRKSEESRERAESLLNKLTDSINYAMRIQSAIIPKETELQKHFDCFVLFRPKDIVSGDFYWFADRDDKKIVVLADCTGHGVPGAFMTIIGNNIINQIVYDYEMHHPDEILSIMPILLSKALLHSEGQVKDGMEAGILTIYQSEKGVEKVEFAGAKNSLFYVQNQQSFEVKGDRKAIDAYRKEDYDYQRNIIPIEPQHEYTFYLSSDGYQDQYSLEHKRKFYSVHLRSLLFEIAEKPLEEQKQILGTTFDAWKGAEMQRDDVTILGLRIGDPKN